MTYHVLGRTFTRTPGTNLVTDAETQSVTDVSQWAYTDRLDDAQIMALTIGGILRGVI